MAILTILYDYQLYTTLSQAHVRTRPELDENVSVHNVTDDNGIHVRFFVSFDFNYTYNVQDTEHGPLSHEVYLAQTPQPREWQNERTHNKYKPVIIEVKIGILISDSFLLLIVF